MRDRPAFRYALPLGLALLLAAYWADATLGLLPYVPSVENRAPRPRPPVKLDHLDPFPAAYEDYFNDHFRWRGRFQRLDAHLKRWTGDRSPLPDLVTPGRAGWFYKGGLQMDLYRGKRRFSPGGLDAAVAELRRRRDSVAARGGHYYLVVAPLKAHVYPQYLPEYATVLHRDYAARQLYARLGAAGVSYVDLHTPLAAAAARDSLPLYFRTDHHWTDAAGLLAARTIVDRLVADGRLPHPLDPADFYFSRDTLDGMVLAKFALRNHPGQELRPVLHRHGGWLTEEIPRPDVATPPGFRTNGNYLVERRRHDPAAAARLPRLFCVRESFGENILRPLSEPFGRSVYLFDNWIHGLNPGEYRREGGDVFLQLVWEGFILNLQMDYVEDRGW